MMFAANPKFFFDTVCPIGILRRSAMAGLVLICLGSCSDSGPSSSSGAEQLGVTKVSSPESPTPELKDLTPSQATSVLRAWGFAGKITVVDNGKCASGNRPGKTYRQEPTVNEMTQDLGEVVIYAGCFDISFSVSTGGSIKVIMDDPAERTDLAHRFNLKAYNSLDFTVVTQSNYSLVSVLVNGSKITPRANQRYRLPELASDQNVSIVFSEDPAPASDPAPAPDPAPAATYTITATLLGGDCTVSPSGAVTVNEGANQDFDITVNSGVVQFLEVDGGVEACNQFGCTYSFNNVVADHTLDVLCN